MALSADRVVPVSKLPGADGGFILDYPVAASQTIYKGAFVNNDAGGDCVPATGTAKCLGIAVEQVDNSAGADAAKKVKVLQGALIEHTLASVAKTDIGSPVYASDDTTLTLTASGSSPVGYVVHVTATNTCLVQMVTPGEI